MPSVDELRAEMASFKWWHSIDLGNGLITPGKKSPALMAEEIRNTFDGLDVSGKSLLDIGAWNGAFSIEAKRRGAARVVALDRPNNLPDAKASLEFAIRTTGLAIETVERDMETPGALDGLGSFDIVLFLGVFYHLLNPIQALREIAAATAGTLVLETYIEATTDPRPTMVFFPGSELAGDASNWWGPNVACVEQLLKTVGYARIETIRPADRNRLVCRAFR